LGVKFKKSLPIGKVWGSKQRNTNSTTQHTRKPIRKREQQDGEEEGSFDGQKWLRKDQYEVYHFRELHRFVV